MAAVVEVSVFSEKQLMVVKVVMQRLGAMAALVVPMDQTQVMAQVVYTVAAAAEHLQMQELAVAEEEHWLMETI